MLKIFFKHINTLIALSVCFVPFVSFGQTHQDSIKELDLMVKQIETARDNSQKLDYLCYAHYYQNALLGEITEKNCFKFNTSYAKQGIDLAVELEKYDTLKALSSDLGYIYDIRKQYDSSFNYYNNCLNMLEAVGRYDLTTSIAYNVLYNNGEMQKQIEESNRMKLEQKRKIEKLTYLAIGALLLFIGFLVFFFIKTNRKNKQLAQQKHQIEESKREIDNSIDYAQNVQQAILANESKLKKLVPNSFLLFMPRDKVSGDFLWIYKKEHLVYIAVADCTGHGVPGALLSIVGHFLFDGILAAEVYKSPSDVLNELHTSLIKALNQNDPHNDHNNDGMDVGVIEINTTNNHLKFSGANRTLVHIRNSELSQYKGVKRPIGGTQFDYKYEFINEELTLENGDLLYSFSDGYQDQIGGDKGKKIMSKNLVNLLLQHSKEDISVQKNIFKQYFIDYKKDYEQVDDVLLMGIKI